MTRTGEFYVGGERVEPEGGEVLKVVSPSSEEVVGEVRASAP
ncbi:hypothetical protein [Nonomuraea jabiensis]|uniref:Acyl-CoA reductase-like NAD-dependent aldehyde dehydrogenase n=1 Tax=Nonomuraea jabiensis TaxID=882448 RepID=A0A7W9LF32_9ACTN|nr:hypothetical protein [Nonomuraea jabiensis]MBB5781318.1 acyl-CoA reductase-like NAD-dependent aldehyde dehydrogenase [Nonomuraea jabiensis]